LLNLTILQTLRAKRLPNNQVLLTRKLIEAIDKLQSLWPGSLTVFMEETHKENDNLDKKVFNFDELSFKLELLSFDTITADRLRNQTSLVLATVGYRQNHISQVCREADVPCIYVSEYTLRTRKQIAVVENPDNLLRQFWRSRWEEAQEWKQQRAIKLASGLQCNGTPTYEVYRPLNPNTMLFFDTRITEDMLATFDDIERRTRDETMPIRLVFSGRLNRMKGANQLLDVALELNRLGTPFEMFISGAGDLEKSMHQRIAEEGLGNCVKMMGVPDFKTIFLPFVKANIDLFVCCHPQGDPSCTYIETMSCGVPIVGYANEAFEGIVEQSKAGWLVEINQPKLLAKKISELSRKRNEIKAMSFKSLEFAKERTFDKTFKARIEHMERIATKKEFR
jgi:colanic acid/amylovoran biosynthesis glycosyltransferase